MRVHDGLPTRKRSLALFVIILGITRSHLETGLQLTAWPLGIVVTASFVSRLIGRYSGGVLGGIELGVLPLGLLLLGLLPTHPSNLDIVRLRHAGYDAADSADVGRCVAGHHFRAIRPEKHPWLAGSLVAGSRIYCSRSNSRRLLQCAEGAAEIDLVCSRPKSQEWP